MGYSPYGGKESVTQTQLKQLSMHTCAVIFLYCFYFSFLMTVY